MSSSFLDSPRTAATTGPSSLPYVVERFPEIADAGLDRDDDLPSCSAIEALERQERFISQVLAYQALAMLARFRRDVEIG